MKEVYAVLSVPGSWDIVRKFPFDVLLRNAAPSRVERRG